MHLINHDMVASVYINDCLSKLLIPMNFYHDSRLPHETSNELFCFHRRQFQGLVAKYIMSANENSDFESSMGKFSARGYQYEPEYSMYLYKLDQHLLGAFVHVHKYGNVVNIIIIQMA